MKNGRILCLIITVGFLDLSRNAAIAQSEALVHFEKNIRPVLVTSCLKCHGPEKQKGGLRLDSLNAILKGGETGPALEPGRPEKSLILSALRYEDLEMPPKAPLASSVIDQFATWISNGAPWATNLDSIRPADDKITATDREWWAFQPVRKASLPDAVSKHPARNPVDRFV